MYWKGYASLWGPPARTFKDGEGRVISESGGVAIFSSGANFPTQPSVSDEYYLRLTASKRFVYAQLPVGRGTDFLH
eukprot:10070424-Karenia_brevis.AAC.1